MFMWGAVSLSLFLCGISGLLAATVLFPYIAAKFYSKTVTSPNNTQNTDTKNIAVLIPAHNEEKVIGSTLENVFAAVDYVHQYHLDLGLNVYVGADSCTDKTLEIAGQTRAKIKEFQFNSKWQTLKSLVSYTENDDWVVLIDAGTIIEEDFFLKLIEKIVSDDFVAIMPCYFSETAGKFEKYAWNLEQFIKNFENNAGGPVTAHGACVCYEREVLVEVFKFLGDKNWTNDDVILPLTIRSLFPVKESRYCPDIKVKDVSVKPGMKREFSRRLRMIEGNVEWIKFFFTNLSRESPFVTLLVLRRLFRLPWGYWFLFILASLVIALISFGFGPLLFIACSLILTVLLIKFKLFSGIFEAFIASLCVPAYFVFGCKKRW